jgi:hypothetical protein
MTDPFSIFLPAMKDLAQKGVQKSAEDLTEDVEKLADGEPGQAIADALTPGLASTEAGNVIQDHLGNAIDNAVSLVQGDPVDLSIDPNFVPEFAEAAIEDVGDVAAEIVDDLLGGLF